MRSGYHQVDPIKPREEFLRGWKKGTCVYCKGPLPPRRRKYCCWEHEYKFRFETRDFMTWAEFRLRILQRDRFICYSCSREFKEGGLEVHHLVPIHRGGEEFEESNCVTLCVRCHKAKHRRRSLEQDKRTRQLTFEEVKAKPY